MGTIPGMGLYGVFGYASGGPLGYIATVGVITAVVFFDNA
jgi:hypothetical protein